MSRLLFLVSSLYLLATIPSPAGERIVTAGGGVTEIVYALGLDSFLVGVDTSSVYPESATKLPQVGYARALSSEGILSLQPTMLISYEEAGPPSTLSHLKTAGVRIVLLPSKPEPANVEERIRVIARELGADDRAQDLIDQLRMDLSQVPAKAGAVQPVRVLFVYARAGGVLNVSGSNTAADTMIRLAGGINAVTGFEGYKPLTAEAAVAAAPDVILMTSRGLEEAGGIKTLLSHPGLALTPAAGNQRVVQMDDLLLLGFGPRLGQAVKELSRLLYEPASITTAKVR